MCSFTNVMNGLYLYLSSELQELSRVLILELSQVVIISHWHFWVPLGTSRISRKDFCHYQCTPAGSWHSTPLMQHILVRILLFVSSILGCLIYCIEPTSYCHIWAIFRIVLIAQIVDFCLLAINSRASFFSFSCLPLHLFSFQLVGASLAVSHHVLLSMSAAVAWSVDDWLWTCMFLKPGVCCRWLSGTSEASDDVFISDNCCLYVTIVKLFAHWNLF